MATQQSKSAKIHDAIQSTIPYVASHIDKSRDLAFKGTDISDQVVPYQKKTVGKVRDIYYGEDVVVLISTDRQTGFDRALAKIPFKGQVLNLTSQWWFAQAKAELSLNNAVLAVPDPNVTIAVKCTPFPIEFVMRGYMTGSTATSIWKNYSNGMRSYCGHELPDGLVKNQKLPMGNILTPTTKDDVHDELISAAQVVSQGHMSQADWDACSELAIKLFNYGQQVAASRGLILVDTKYEFGKTKDGEIVIIDEVHTPDSSRYWVAETYDENFANGKNPENIDKEFLRLWFVDHCDPYKDETLPDAPPELVNELSRRYIMLYELITGQKFEFPEAKDVEQRVTDNIIQYFKSS